MILERIHNKIEEYYKRYKDMPNTIMMPEKEYIVLKEKTKSLLVEYYNCNIQDKVFDMDILIVENEDEIRATKIFRVRGGINE